MSLFTLADVLILQRDRLVLMARQYFPGVALDPDFLLLQLQAAEDDLETQLRIFFEPVEILAMSTPDTERATLLQAGTRTADDPGYPSDPLLFRGDRWGIVRLRFKPIISIVSFSFNYPDPYSVLYDVPQDWLRIDKKYGEVQLVPTSNFISFPVTTLLLTAATGGTEIPYFLQVRYQAGLTDARKNHPALIDLIFKMASVRVIENLYLPSSGSISADGLSQSISMDASKYADANDKRIETLRQKFQGIRLVVC